MKTKKRFITLIEIMIVIFLISLIGGVIGYNMKGSLEKGKAFKTEQAMNQMDDIFQLEAAKGELTYKQIAADPRAVLEKSGLVKNPEELLKDGWNNPFVIKVSNDGFEFCSKKYEDYKQKHSIEAAEKQVKVENHVEKE